MAITTDLLDEHQALASKLVMWHRYWRDIAKYVLPQTEAYDFLLGTSPGSAISAVSTMSAPAAYDKSKDIYDMTTMWAIERMSAGLLSLKTPEAQNWHDLSVVDEFDDDFELPHEERLALERVRNYLFKLRANPKSGFWTAHKATLRSCAAFGDGWMLITEKMAGAAPWQYEHVPLPEMTPGVDDTGNPDRNYRVFNLTAYQIAQKFGAEKCGPKVLEYANDPKNKTERFKVMHGIRPRNEGRQRAGVMGAEFESHYMIIDEKHHIGESGFFEFPYVRYAWSDTGARAQCEGPVAIALAEVKALQELGKQELLAGAQALRPPIGTHGRNFQRLNFNPGQNNPGLINAEGRPLFAPLNTGARPDFARAIIEARQNNLKEMMYVSLWQALLQDREQTATEALLRAQEKGELLGPVGISLNKGLAATVDREIGIMGRHGAFREDSPLALPESLNGANVAPTFTAPLDRLRQMGDLVAMQRLAGFVGDLANVTQRPEITGKLNIESMVNKAQEILGAPTNSLVSDEEYGAAQQQNQQLAEMAQLLEQAKAGGDAASAIGQGAQAMAAGAQATEASSQPAPQQVPQRAGAR